MVERSLSMREVPGSIPGASNSEILFQHNFAGTGLTTYIKTRQAHTPLLKPLSIFIVLHGSTFRSKKWYVYLKLIFHVNFTQFL